MPPPIAALACSLFIAYLFWGEFRQPDRQRISWAPFVWMFLAGSRFASRWLNLGSPLTPRAYDEGSPIDRAVFFSLILWGATVLARRQINWGRLLTENKWIALYLLYCLSSLLWTDQPFVLTKRWVKDLGNPIMALVLLTERQPYGAVGMTLRRLSFVMLPLSVLFIKYYPNLGRGYTAGGAPMSAGIGNQKNDLGLICLMTGMYFAWTLLQRRPGGRASAGRSDVVTLVQVGSLLWLLHISNSQTSIACLVVATGVLFVARIPQIASRPSRILPLLVTAALVYATLRQTPGFTAYVLALMGRDETLTNRAEIWETVRGQAGSPLVGVGFMSFWTPERTALVASELGASLNQAHNGYLEQYLNLGYIGVAFIIVIMLSALLRVRQHLDRDPTPALLRLCFLVTAAMYNYTEASFYGINNMWVLLLTASFDTTGAVPSSSHMLGSDLAARPSAVRQKLGRLAVRAAATSRDEASGV
jgi:O-antigen ligase